MPVKNALAPSRIYQSSAPMAAAQLSPPLPSFAAIDGQTITCRGGWLKTASVFDEIWQENSLPEAPDALIDRIGASGLKADLFTFAERIPGLNHRPRYHCDLDNLAVADASDYTRWWEALPHESRKNVRKAQKRGVLVTPVELTDDLVAGIKRLYDETPVRQGRRFIHYHKDLATIKRDNASYLERSQFIGAFLGPELIGFLKMVYVGNSARIMQILAKDEHYDKHPTNAMLAAAMQLCAAKPVAALIYGQYIYGRKHHSSVTEFKRRNGFHEVLIPRYYVPYTAKGRIALALGLHRGLARLVPEVLVDAARKARVFAQTRLIHVKPPSRTAPVT